MSQGLSASSSTNVARNVRIQGVTKRFGAFVAVSGVDLEVGSGTFMTLLGPSGSGKTTLLQMVAGLLTPDAGTIRFGEADVTRTPPHLRDIGMVFQNYALFPHLTVGENIAFPLRLRQLAHTEVAKRTRASLELIGLPHVADRKVSELSGGQQQRIALARALVYQPGVLLMDEPLGALDRKLRDQMKFEIKMIQQQMAVTVIYVTHDQDEALTMSDRIAVMNHGHVVQVAEPHEIYHRPRSRFVADFVGDSNLIAGRLSEASGRDARIHTAIGMLVGRSVVSATEAQGPLCLMIRPEHARIVAVDEAEDNVVQAVVQQTLFRGEFTQTSAKTADGSLFKLKSPGVGPKVKAGDNVKIGWRASDAVIIADDVVQAP